MKNKILLRFEFFQKNEKKILWKKLLESNILPKEISKNSENSNCHINVLFNTGTSNLVILLFSTIKFFSISGILKVISHEIKLCDLGCKGPT